MGPERGTQLGGDDPILGGCGASRKMDVAEGSKTAPQLCARKETISNPGGRFPVPPRGLLSSTEEAGHLCRPAVLPWMWQEEGNRLEPIQRADCCLGKEPHEEYSSNSSSSVEYRDAWQLQAADETSSQKGSGGGIQEESRSNGEAESGTKGCGGGEVTGSTEADSTSREDQCSGAAENAGGRPVGECTGILRRHWSSARAAVGSIGEGEVPEDKQGTPVPQRGPGREARFLWVMRLCRWASSSSKRSDETASGVRHDERVIGARSGGDEAAAGDQGSGAGKDDEGGADPREGTQGPEGGINGIRRRHATERGQGSPRQPQPRGKRGRTCSTKCGSSSMV